MRSNPNALRLNLTQSWRSDAAITDKYTQSLVSEIQFDFLMAIRWRRFQERSNNGLIYSHTKFRYFSNGHIHLHLYFYDGFVFETLFKLVFAKRKRKKSKKIWHWRRYKGKNLKLKKRPKKKTTFLQSCQKS